MDATHLTNSFPEWLLWAKKLKDEHALLKDRINSLEAECEELRTKASLAAETSDLPAGPTKHIAPQAADPDRLESPVPSELASTVDLNAGCQTTPLGRLVLEDPAPEPATNDHPTSPVRVPSEFASTVDLDEVHSTTQLHNSPSESLVPEVEPQAQHANTTSTKDIPQQHDLSLAEYLKEAESVLVQREREVVQSFLADFNAQTQRSNPDSASGSRQLTMAELESTLRTHQERDSQTSREAVFVQDFLSGIASPYVRAELDQLLSDHHEPHTWQQLSGVVSAYITDTERRRSKRRRIL